MTFVSKSIEDIRVGSLIIAETEKSENTYFCDKRVEWSGIDYAFRVFIVLSCASKTCDNWFNIETNRGLLKIDTMRHLSFFVIIGT